MAHLAEFSVWSMCRVLAVYFSGFYAWFKEPLRQRVLEDARQTVLIHQAWADSDKVYGSRRGNCHDNVVAESFFHLLKREPIRRQTYLIRDAARQDVFGYIEMFYNPTGKHTNNGMLSPVNYEIKQQKMNEPGA